MGAKNSRPMSSSYGGRDAKRSFAPPSRIEQMVAEAIQRSKKIKDEKGEPLAHFTRILMRAPKLNNVFYSVKAVFKSFDKSGTGSISVGELQEALSRLTMQDVTEEETREFFAEVDVYEDGRISFKEFIVCLALGYVLNTIPALRSGASSEASAGGKSAERPKPRNPRILKLQKEGRRPSFLMGEGPKIAEAFSLVMDAYLTFDSEGKGFITKDNMRDFITKMGARSPSKSGVSKTARSAGEMGPGTSILTEERMEEMDWDGSGRVSYSEFVYSFLGWVGFEEGLEDEEDGAASGAGGKSSRK